MDSASFPLIFFDGGLEFDAGDILVHPSLQFNVFISLISQKVGISPHRISTYLVRRKMITASPELRRKLPIHESSDFASIAEQKDCHILAITKGSRKARVRRRGERGKAAAAKAEIIVPEKTILKRSSAIDVPGPVGQRFWNYERQLRYMQRKMYLMLTGMACASLAAEVAAMDPAASSEWAAGEDPAASSELAAMEASTWEMITAAAEKLVELVICEGCLAAARGRSDDFHFCVYDKVTVGFRSTVGPIQRPSH
ncbi:uncharacterized protein LOC110035610 [Phalaenopsis equestris]|uniref:uncharacterized protein LOC110035610 n=1 Tax=Phalaenopsis equestris TaxID=78828 RepID=UPI0009E58EBB|nr:uncharacterized protein LOC110035610 [Phalaenopsis equestris]